MLIASLITLAVAGAGAARHQGYELMDAAPYAAVLAAFLVIAFIGNKFYEFAPVTTTLLLNAIVVVVVFSHCYNNPEHCTNISTGLGKTAIQLIDFIQTNAVSAGRACVDKIRENFSVAQ
jgi:hypothetical protein